MERDGEGAVGECVKLQSALMDGEEEEEKEAESIPLVASRISKGRSLAFTLCLQDSEKPHPVVDSRF